MKTTRRALRYFWLGLGQLFCFYPEDKTEMIKILKDNRSELLGRTEWESIGEDFRAIGNDIYSSAKKFHLGQ